MHKLRKHLHTATFTTELHHRQADARKTPHSGAIEKTETQSRRTATINEIEINRNKKRETSPVNGIPGDVASWTAMNSIKMYSTSCTRMTWRKLGDLILTFFNVVKVLRRLRRARSACRFRE